MPDTSMCANQQCKQKDTCYRFRAQPSQWQSYSSFKPTNNDAGEAFACDNLISHRDINGNLRT